MVRDEHESLAHYIDSSLEMFCLGKAYTVHLQKVANDRDDRKLYFGLFYTVLPKFIMQTRCSHNLLQFFGITLFEKNSARSNFETFCRSGIEYIKNTENII